MPHKEIQKKIEELKLHVEQAPKETGAFEQTLEHARESIEKYTPEAIHEFADTLQREAEEFEVEHPQITAMINQVMVALSNLGI